MTARASDRLDVRGAGRLGHHNHLFRIGSTTLVKRMERVKDTHCLTKKVLGMGSLPQLGKVLETGGEATVTRSRNTGGARRRRWL